MQSEKIMMTLKSFGLAIMIVLFGTSFTDAHSKGADHKNKKQSQMYPEVQVKQKGEPALAANVDYKVLNRNDHTATVYVSVANFKIKDSAEVEGNPKNVGHLHYQVDNGPVIATTKKKLSFHQLSPGEHVITVQLVDNNHKPIGAQEKIAVNVGQQNQK